MPNLVNPHTGELQYVPDEDLKHLHAGWREETVNEEFNRYLDANRREEYGGGADAAWALVEGALSGATLGLWDVLDSGYGARQRAEYNSGYRALGELAGGIAPAFLTGGGSEAATAGEGVGLLGRILKASPAGWVGTGGRIVEETLGGGRLAKVIAAASEGSAFGMSGAFSHAQMSDDPLTAEALIYGAGLGALTGGGLSIGFQGLGELGRGIQKLRGATEESVGAESPALVNFSHTWEEARDVHALGPEEVKQSRGYQTAEAGGLAPEPPKMSEPPRYHDVAVDEFPPGEPGYRWSGQDIEGAGPKSAGVPEEIPEMDPWGRGAGGEVEAPVEDYARPKVPSQGDLATGDTRLMEPTPAWDRENATRPGKGVGAVGSDVDRGVRQAGELPKPGDEIMGPVMFGDQSKRRLYVVDHLQRDPVTGEQVPMVKMPHGYEPVHEWGWASTRDADLQFTKDYASQMDAEGGRPGGVRGAEDREGRALAAEQGARAWEAKLAQEGQAKPYVGKAEASAQEPLPTPKQVAVGSGQVEAAAQAAKPPAPLHEVLTGIHGDSMPEFPRTVKAVGKLAPGKAAKLGVTLNALGEHSADLEGRVQTLLSDFEKEMGVRTNPGETPAQRWMALRRVAKEAVGGEKNWTVEGYRGPGGPKGFKMAEGPGPTPRQAKGFFYRWRRRVLGNMGDSVGRGLGGKGLGGKVGGALGREGMYVVASVLGGPKGLGLALGGKWLLKSRMAEVVASLGKATPAHLAPLGRTSVWLKDRKKAARDILALHAAAPRVQDLVYETVEAGGKAASALTHILAARASAVIQYLTSIAPKPGPGVDKLHWEPTVTSLLPLAQATEAVASPDRALKRVLAGLAGKEAVTALWLAYPEHMAQTMLTMATTVTPEQLQKMPPLKRQSLSMLTQAPFGSWSPYSPGAAELRSRLFQTGPAASAKVQAQAYQTSLSSKANGRPPETTKIDQILGGGRA